MLKFRLFGRNLVVDWVPLVDSFLKGVSWSAGVATFVCLVVLATTLVMRG